MVMSTKIFLNFYGVGVTILSDWEEILMRLQKDFSHFEVSEFSNPQVTLEVFKAKPKFRHDDDLFSYKSSKVSFFEKEGKRFCSYFGKVDSEIDFNTNEAAVVGEELYPVHEVSYLLVLSRVGKILDLKGLHRIHSGAWVCNETLYLALFPSGTGKSTLLSELMKEKNCFLYSDDSPLVDEKGMVFPFPIRIGFNADESQNLGFDKERSYRLERFRFGAKELYSLKDLDWSVGGPYQEVVLLTAVKGGEASYKESYGFSHFIHLIEEGVIGFGLPILYEYFWEYGLEDFLRKTKIALKRVVALSVLWLKAKKYEVTLSSDPKKSFEMIKELMNKN